VQADAAIQRPFRAADVPGMRRILSPVAATLVALLATGCLMPNGGTPVLVDSVAGDFWSGKGLLTEVSPDRKQCHVVVRDNALIVRRMWVPCTSVHPRRGP
jgi:hypothetical protein